MIDQLEWGSETLKFKCNFSPLQSHSASKKGQFRLGKFLGNVSLVLSVIAIVIGLLLYFVAGLIIVLFIGYYAHCGFSGPSSASCQRDII